MSSGVKSQQKHLVIFIKVLVAISILTSSTKLSRQSTDHTTSRSARQFSLDNSRSHRRDTVDLARSSVTAKQLDIPIFLMDSSTHEISAMEWMSLAKQWNRNTQYSDIIQSNDTIDATIPFPPNKRVLIFHHLMPKTASSTLRQSCQDTQLETCGIEPKGGNKRPDGYISVKRLMQVMNDCPKTRHYCVKSDTQPLIKNYTEFHHTNSFLHLFPFRNYEEWVHSALKQVYFRDGEKGCQEEDALLDQCLPHQYELDFDRYGKRSLSYFLGSLRHLRMKKMLGFEDHHVVLMYDYRYLHETLKSLNAEYDIPLLPGTDAKKNSERPEGTCKDEGMMIRKFHDCFSDALGDIE
jgi:hypothetical protein